MMPTRWIYLYRPEGRILAAKVVVRGDGTAWFVPGEAYFDELMDAIGNGCFSNKAKRMVSPNEGEAFLVAVDEMYRRSSTWIVDTVPPPDST